jgi:ATP-dependent DNA helicase DinG
MAEAVERALLTERALLVEAGTGTGKTLGYLVPAILSGRKVVVSTATRALQEQIVEKDLPLVRAALAAHGVTFRAALMKGLTNYLCKRRFSEVVPLRQIADWAERTETGDRAELEGVPEDAEAWRDVQSSTETRIGAECKYFEACFVTKMRRDAEEAQLVVVNHHLFFADLVLRRGRAEGYASAIPNYDAVIFDEAHQVEDIATDFFGVRVSTSRVEALTREARRTMKGALSLLEQIDRSCRAFFAALRPTDVKRILGEGDWTKESLAAYAKLDAALEALENETEPVIARRIRDLRADLQEILDGSRARVTWLDARERSVSIGASPIDLGPTLRSALFDRVPAIICTSATLTTAVRFGEPSFHFAKARLGAPPEAEEIVVPSPFDFERRAVLYIAGDLPDPQAPSFERAAVERIVELIAVTSGGAFVLCTSTRAMKAIHRALAGRVPGPLLVQGEAPKHVLLARFRTAGDAVLVATMSFWEGVDVPGRALRLVVLDKVPFPVPTDPIVAARCAQIERDGGNPFVEYSIPSAALTLKQGFGRLLRTQRDAGIVAILDSRVARRGYGRRLLDSLPPARRVATVGEVGAFWRALSQT